MLPIAASSSTNPYCDAWKAAANRLGRRRAVTNARARRKRALAVVARSIGLTSLKPQLRDEIRRALAVDRAATLEQRTIDITTTGRRSGAPRRIETAFHRFEDSIYLSGLPGPRPRAWLLNLTAEPHFSFHLKRGAVADLPAIATVITDPAERRRILADFVEGLNQRHGSGSEWPEAVLEDCVHAAGARPVRVSAQPIALNRDP